MADDIYQGYRMPKGSIVVVNTWYVHCKLDETVGLLMFQFDYRAILHDPGISSPLHLTVRYLF